MKTITGSKMISDDEYEAFAQEFWLKTRGHKHIWQVGTDEYGSTTVYFVEDGERYYAEEESDWQREAAEQLGMVYSERDMCWYDEDDERAKPSYDEAYGWREVESDYYRDVL